MCFRRFEFSSGKRLESKRILSAVSTGCMPLSRKSKWSECQALAAILSSFCARMKSNGSHISQTPRESFRLPTEWSQAKNKYVENSIARPHNEDAKDDHFGGGVYAEQHKQIPRASVWYKIPHWHCRAGEILPSS